MSKNKAQRFKVAKAQRHKGTKGNTPSALLHKAETRGQAGAERNKGVKIFCLLVFFLVTVHWSLFTVVNAADVNQIVERIQTKYAEVHDIQGMFHQTSYLKDLDRTEKYSGEFYIKKPSRLRWKYGSPRDEEVLIRGDEIWIYKKSEQQVLKSRFSKEAYSHVPIAMLESLKDLETDYDIKMTADEVLELVPRKRIGFINRLILKTGPGDFPIKSFTIFDLYGNSNVIMLEELKINPGLEDSFFVFEMPSGAELFDYSR
jgi:outer membrane lipoprotein carrier protein